MVENAEAPARPRKRVYALAVLAAILIVGAAVLHLYLRYAETHVSTNDAFVDGRVHVIAPRIPGAVKSLAVTDNELVREGQLLVEMDPRDYAVALQGALASLESERGRLTEIENRVVTAKKQSDETAAALDAAKATLEAHQANLRQAESDFSRAEALWKGGAYPKETFDRAATAREAALAQVKAGEAQVKQLAASLATQAALIRQTESSLPPQKAQIALKEAAVKAAELNVSYTRVLAPADGHVTRRTVEVGNQVQAGQPLLSIVSLDPEQVWITANYKETQLTRVRPGQPVTIRVDAYPDQRLRGRVDTIMAGTGSVFSLFPPENATGNFVKVVQRIPVKIVIESGGDPARPLRIGMSVVPTILTER